MTKYVIVKTYHEFGPASHPIQTQYCSGVWDEKIHPTLREMIVSIVDGREEWVADVKVIDNELAGELVSSVAEKALTDMQAIVEQIKILDEQIASCESTPYRTSMEESRKSLFGALGLLAHRASKSI